MKTEEMLLSKNNTEIENKRFLQDGDQSEKRKQGGWTVEQQKKYILFIQKYKYELQNKQKRKDNKIFKNMSDFIGSRDGIQCRSHHMKLLRTHTKIKRIIDHFKRKFKDQFDQEWVLKTTRANKQTSSASSENPLNKFSALSTVKKEQITKNQEKCNVELSILVNPVVLGVGEVEGSWTFQNNFPPAFWNLWPAYGFYSFAAPQP